MALSAVIFDLDGTLIDTNHQHVLAWRLAMKQHGYHVSSDRIAVEIGKGGDKLVPSILGQEIDSRDGDALRHAETKEFTRIAESEKFTIFPGVKNLLEDLRRRGLKIGLATSSKKGGLETTLKSADADWESLFDVIVTAEQVSESKPAPALLDVAVKKLTLSPAQCAMVGDTPYDADCARDAGVICLGITCGKLNDEKTLRATGMRHVYRDPAHIAEHLDEFLRIASPGKAILTNAMIESLMHEALAVAKEAIDKGEVPIGCVIADGQTNVIARGHNELNASQIKTAHAEMVAFSRSGGKVPTDARDLILVSTLEPCVMCLGAAMEASVDTIVYGMAAPTDGGRLRVRPPVSPDSQMPRIVGNILPEKSRRLFEQFLERKPTNPQQLKFVRELLSRA